MQKAPEHRAATTQRRIFHHFILYPSLCLLLAAVVLSAILRPVETPPPTPEQRTKVHIANLHTCLQIFQLETGRYPTDDEGLQALLTQPPATPGWRGPYLDSLPLDAWNHSFQYKFNATPRPSYELRSPGPDGLDGTPDDMTSPYHRR